MRIVLVLAALTAVCGNDEWSKCPASCKCIWSQGKKAAECQNAGLTAIPGELHTEVQLLTLNGNNIHSLPSYAFQSVKLMNLHKVFIKHSHLQLLDKDALAAMKVLIEVDFSYNKIEHLHRDLFRQCEKIREVIITNNPIQTLEEGLFHNLTFLQKVDFSFCLLRQIKPGTFYHLPMLKSLELQGNRLEHMNLSVVEYLPNLVNLDLKNNTWKCDCHLRPLKRWVMQNRLYSIPTLCYPSERPWTDLTDEGFACRPEVVAVMQEGYHLGCLIFGDPLPEVQWFFNAKPVSNHSYTGAEYLLRSGGGWHNLTIRHARSRDSGEYKCMAKSSGGVHEQLLDVRFSVDDDDEFGYAGGVGMTEVWPLVVGVVIGALLLLLAIALIVCCCICKRQGGGAVTKKDVNGVVVGMDSEEKSLMHSVNPVQKPPRRQETALNTSETELLDSVSLPYNENGSILGSSHLETPTGSTPGGTIGRAPDLLAFPVKKDSPSTKPLGSPGDNFIRGKFGTLPMARSHSPFSPPAPVVVPRAGYVTIPRRPRAPSWSASLSPVLVSPDESYCEPVYDNLGPRTTADGSSVLSLNKMDMGLPVGFKNRPLPLTPYEPINEHRRQSWSRATPDVSDERQSWSRGTPDVGDERQSLITPSPQASIVPAKKIPPNPPPKPKKKKNAYEDEGEDGTEV